MITINNGGILHYYENRKSFPQNANIGDYFMVTSDGTQNSTIKQTYLFTGVEWKMMYSNTDELAGKDAIYCGDSITNNVNAVTNFADRVSWHFGMTRVKKIGTTNYANSGTTMMNRAPSNPIGSPNFQQILTVLPNYNAQTFGLLFISYLTNDVGLNLPNYTIENFESDFTNAIVTCLNKGYPSERIKVNTRFYLTLTGLNYTTVSGSGVTTPATMERYIEFSDKIKEICDLYDIQWFDHWDSVAGIPNADTNLDNVKRHPNAYLHNIFANNIIDQLTI